MLSFVMARADGDVPTGAHFIREYVTNHPFYKKDSIVSSNLASNLTLQVMNLFKDTACDCEKDTHSESCDGDCE
jgi:hypothetical protein